MFTKGYVSMATKVSEELAFKRAQFALEQAQSKRAVLVNYSKNKMIKELTGAVETARASELSKLATVERDRSALKRLDDQIRRCKVAPPLGGRVRYAAPIGAGAVVRDGQVIFRIEAD